MKNSKKGISLIVLIITIIVIIILATAILVSVISNNPISEANKARYESDRDNMQAVFTNTVGKIMAENQGVVNVTPGQINTVTKDAKETTGEVAYTVDNATVAANASGKIVFDKGTNDATTYYTGKKLPIYAAGETKWYVDSEGHLILNIGGHIYGSTLPQIIKNNVQLYYGKKVLNYKTGNEMIDSQVEWQIFHSDGNNIYLIATDYINGNLAPNSRNGIAPDYSGCMIWFNSLYEDYNGFEDINDIKLQKLNSKYYEYIKNNNITNLEYDYNMQVIAYLMDTSKEVWGKFAGEDASYAIGGPTLELLFDSYNAKKGTKYICQTKNQVGYQISIDDGKKWSVSYNNIIDKDDSQYAIDTYPEIGGKAYAMWVVSPSIYDEGCLMYVHCSGTVGGGSIIAGRSVGLRPVVCLKSDTALVQTEEGFFINK